jgi:hypothetical protein
MTRQKQEASMANDDGSEILSHLPKSFQILARFALRESEKEMQK